MVNGRLPTYDHLREVAGEKPLSSETQLDVSGGSGDTRYFLSGNVKGDGGIIANTGAQRQNLRANIDQTFSDRFSVAFSSAFNRTSKQRRFPNNDNSGASLTYAIAYIPDYVPITPVNGVFPNPGVTYKGSNPLQTVALAQNDESAVRFTGGLTATYQAIASANTSLKIVAAGGIDFFNQRNKVWAPRELYFEANQANPGVATLGNADSHFTNWNVNAIHTYTATSFKTTTSAGVQWEDRQLNRARVEADGVLPGQQNINQGSVLTPFEELTHERTVGLYAQEEWLGMHDRLLLSAGARAERSSANGEVNKFYFFPKAAGSYRFPSALGEGSDLKLRVAYGETGNQPLFGQKFTTLQGGQVIGGHVGTVVGNVAGDLNIRPERTREIEAGKDASPMRGRASLGGPLVQGQNSDPPRPGNPAPAPRSWVAILH